MLKRRIALAVAAVAVLAGGTAVALGATSSPHAHSTRRHGQPATSKPGLLKVATAYLGISAAQLREQLDSGKTLAQIAAATPGKSEAGLIAALVAAARTRTHDAAADPTSRIDALVHGAAGRSHAWSRRGLLRAATLAYLGIERKALLKQLRSGRTLVQIADATPGKSAEGLREALIAAATKHLDERLAAHALGKTAEQQRLARVEAKIDVLMNRVLNKAGKHESGSGGHGAAKARRHPHHRHEQG